MKLFHVALPTIAMLIASMPTLATPPLPQKSISKPAVKSLTTLFRNDAPLLRSTDPGAERFRAIGQLKADLTCTAELIAGADEPAADRQALILTAGHCVDKAMGPNEVRIDQPAGTGWRFTPAFFIDTQSQHRSFEVDRVMFGTMKKADIAILRLKASYGDMRALGVKPLHVMSAPSYPDMPIELVHVPVEGVPETEQFLRHSVCHADGETAIFEDWTPWYWRPAVPNDCVGVAPGTSGAPVVQMGDSRVIGVLNTTVDRHLTGCGLSRPCEWTDDGSIGVREGASYFIPVGTVAEALRPDSTFDTKRLDPGDGVVLRRSKGWSTQSQIVGDDGTRQPATWMLRIDPEFEWIRYKTGPANTTTCDSDGYGAQLKAADQPLLHLRTPSQEGITMMCVIGKRFGFTP